MAQGATQDMCIGYSNGNGYNVDVVYQGVQQQSMSSICGNFQKTLNNFHSFCNPGPVNCRTNSNGNLLTFGVSTSDRDSGFSCVTAAFVQTLQASVIPGPVGLGCIDLDQGTSTKKRSRIEGPVEIEPRDLSSPSSIAGIGDQITVASGRRLTLTALQFIAPAAGAVVPTLVGGFFTSLVPDIGTAMGTTGQNMGTAISNLSPWNVVTAFDAGVNGGPGNVNANDWQIIIGALAHALQNHGSATALGAKFSDTTTGTVLLDVAMLVTQN
ncbi:hypothetical protein G7Y89_g10816 [Cudoniella acicularis]|uniref:Uncharacterized protein n=1 Tax=Cudoniella acicularis TaxID=354080 RepID=A0A8H4REV0_9HELO|nr:hypothetical protein G7Y89_g10816 [Cudoniella acicularis]